MSMIESILAGVPIPEVVTVRQLLPRPRLAPGQLEETLSPAALAGLVRRGESIAVAVGSRGVADQAAVVARLVASLRAAGAEPFIVPAMGSHGGATGEGQAELLAGMGVSERTVGAPVRSSMEVERIGEADGLPVLVDRLAWRADGIVIVNRVKPHPSFRGDRESGLAKMIAIGLGKQAGAQAYHSRGMQALAATVFAVASHVLATGRVRAGVAQIENAHHEPCHVELIPGSEILAREPALLERARGLQPTLPFAELDVLVVDRIGKNIAGTGVDCNVVGRYSNPALSGGPADHPHRGAAPDPGDARQRQRHRPGGRDHPPCVRPHDLRGDLSQCAHLDPGDERQDPDGAGHRRAGHPRGDPDHGRHRSGVAAPGAHPRHAVARRTAGQPGCRCDPERGGAHPGRRLAGAADLRQRRRSGRVE